MKILKALFLSTLVFILIFSVNSCKKSNALKISEPTVKISIGDSIFGGIVAYILEPGDKGYISNQTHGLIATKEDKYFGNFGCNMTIINGADGTEIGFGYKNTQEIVESCSEPRILAKICKDLVVNGYDDWYMPSKDELSKIIVNRNAIGGIYPGTPPYVSSSIIDSVTCWGQYVSIDSMKAIDRFVPMRTRPIRSF